MSTRKSFITLLTLLLLVILVCFYRSFLPGQALFSNDGPLSIQNTGLLSAPASLYGIWWDVNWVGAYNGNFSPNFFGLMLALPPLWFNNLHLPIAILFLGMCAWLFFRQAGFGPTVAILAALAAALNGNFFSNGCWGLSTRETCLGMTFLAMAAIASPGHWIAKSILAGFAVGLSISEGADNGAIFSLFVAAYATAHAVLEADGWATKILRHGVRMILIVVAAVVMAFPSLSAYMGISITGVAGMEEKQQSKEARWDWATQWSLPKLETLRVIIPGLFGYRLDTGDGGNYWGTVGQQPGWEQHHQGFPRHSGSGEYAGVLVALLAGYGVAQSLRKKGGAFTPVESKMVWFWAAMGVISLLLAWGRHAPFYHLIYILPYFSAIRNPMKYMHPFHMVLMILFAYGLLALARQYLSNPKGAATSLTEHIQAWWSKAVSFEKRWVYTMAGLVAFSVLACLMYYASQGDLIKFLTRTGFTENDAKAIALFSVKEVGMFILYLSVSSALVFVIMSGAFAGGRTKWAWMLLGFILLTDLMRANSPWIRYFNYQERYATNPWLDLLRDKPYEHRVAMPPFQIPGQNFAILQQLYHVEWLQHHMPYYRVQSSDVSQEPRMPADKLAYRSAIGNNIVRLWELTNTRYLFGLAQGFVEGLNAQLDPGRNRFKVVMPFTVSMYPGKDNIMLVETNKEGPFALIEFTGALPRAKLYSSWQVSTNDQDTLKKLADPAFDPAQTVLVANPINPPMGGAVSNAGLATVIHTAYAPKRVELSTQASVPTVLLLNDKFDPFWKVKVDGQPATVLRCNFIMRGVQLPPGHHTVVFQLSPKIPSLWVMLSCEIVGLLLLIYLFMTRNNRTSTTGT
ncbi:MAG: hypothetical protein WCO56_28340 [Verrucomicrobiota bacterium]